MSLPSATAVSFASTLPTRRCVSLRHTCRVKALSRRLSSSRLVHLRTLCATPSVDTVPQDDDPVEDVFDVVNKTEERALCIGTIKRWNQGGVIIRAGSVRGFCPYSRLDPSRLKEIDFERSSPIDGSALINQPIKCIVTDGRAIVSETAYWTHRALDYYKPGDVVKGKVIGIQEYGVFVAIPSEDGQDHGVRGFIHVSELSWDVVTRPEAIVQIGDEVEAFIKHIKRYTNRIEMSLRHESLDPLKESISSLLPLEGEMYQNMTWEAPEMLLPELTVIMDTLKAEPGIEDVQPARQAEVQHKVSLDLELWLSKEEVEDGFNLVAWSGRTLQEIHVKTDLTREDMKSTLRDVLKRTM